mmetsp:Transcript_78346/g.226541  ORF Transcript_78346/g.226541 Transcript_78346/m.226541 type:complete len:212 (-) Transcript_78346:1887-2522(-)
MLLDDRDHLSRLRLLVQCAIGRAELSGSQLRFEAQRPSHTIRNGCDLEVRVQRLKPFDQAVRHLPEQALRSFMHPDPMDFLFKVTLQARPQLLLLPPKVLKPPSPTQGAYFDDQLEICQTICVGRDLIGTGILRCQLQTQGLFAEGFVRGIHGSEHHDDKGHGRSASLSNLLHELAAPVGVPGLVNHDGRRLPLTLRRQLRHVEGRRFNPH